MKPIIYKNKYLHTDISKLHQAETILFQKSEVNVTYTMFPISCKIV